MSVHDAIAAVPTIASRDPVNKDLLRNYLVKRTIYPLGADEDPEAFEALDTETGSIPIGLGWNGRIYWLDSDDTTTAHDGTTCLVTDDGYRYKLEVVDFKINSVLDKDETDPPEDAELGDAYLVPSGASGDWGDHPDEVAIWTSRGWVFIAPKTGSWLYIEDEDAYYHYTVGGAWAAGVGQSALSNNTVRPNHVVGGRTHWVVVNQTTNTPPGSPATGDAYIVGGSPTGDWSGHAAKIAQWTGAAWLILSPAEGWTAYDQNANTTYVYSGSAWASQRGAWIKFNYIAASSGDVATGAGSGGYSYSATTAPTTSQLGRFDNNSLTHQANQTGSVLRFRYRARTASAIAGVTVGLFRDSETNAIDWIILDGNTVNVEFIVTAVDAASHVYKIRYIGDLTGFVFTRSQFSVEEAA